MRILVISDTHGRLEGLQKVLEKEPPFDRVFHMGDGEGQEHEISRMVNCPLDIVSGNNDYFTSLPKEKKILLNDRSILLTHGHYYYLYMGNQYLAKHAEEMGCNMVCYGHTHVPVIERIEGILVMNPGSLTYPRQENHRPSYIVMEMDKSGQSFCEIRYL